MVLQTQFFFLVREKWLTRKKNPSLKNHFSRKVVADEMAELVLLSSVGNWSFSCCSNNIFHEKHFMINLYSELILKIWQNLVIFLTIFCQPLGQTQFVPFDFAKKWLYIRLIASFISVILHKE